MNKRLASPVLIALNCELKMIEADMDALSVGIDRDLRKRAGKDVTRFSKMEQEVIILNAVWAGLFSSRYEKR
jgi:hypothetical protein